MEKEKTYILGIDLSGPTNTADTACLAFQEEGNALHLTDLIRGAKDGDIYQLAADLITRGRLIVGLDAPLSYNPGGGDRPADRALREKVAAVGLHPGSVMTPTMTRMAYLTLRGITIARGLQSTMEPPPRIVEVHPGAAMALRGAPIDDVRAYKKDRAARHRLLGWLFTQGVICKQPHRNPEDHGVAACGAALAAWKWKQGKARWREPAAPPHHPFDFAC